LEPLLGDLSETCGGGCGVGEDPAALITVDLLILAWRLAVGTQARRLERGWGFFGANRGSLHLSGGSRLRVGRCCCPRALHGRLRKRRGRRSIRRRGSSVPWRGFACIYARANRRRLIPGRQHLLLLGAARLGRLEGLHPAAQA